MGRLNAAHQFLRTIAITAGIAIVGAITLGYVGHRTGNVETVREILAGEDVLVFADYFDAIADGFALAIAIVSLFVALSIPSAAHLVRTRGKQVVSAR